MNWKRNYLTAALAAGALCLPAAHTAFAADNCKNVRIIIKNGTGR